MQVYIENSQSLLDIDEERMSQITRAVIANEQQVADEVSIGFVETDRICELHDQFFDDPSSTDCISFPIDPPETPGYRVLGEVFVCPETALLYCKKNGGNPTREAILYVVHGLLHLMGYDDIEDDDRAAMRTAEARHLALLEKASLLDKES